MTKNQKIFKLMLNQNLIILKMKEKRTGGNFTELNPGFVDEAGGNFTITNKTLLDNGVGASISW